ncbi:hypothetical protein JNUCC1_00256 [Lentibacillus sp. JNUCC-1]|uniref:beta-carotene 15,15'-monooxygenase n=1 Tax=Lentibacillus sp. JNUCC-1 TaxID=2654513 RepID=UPI0012E7EE5E|nr:beta-carotene 15,15'-monooxygenase [Lentibacillus sp. JNUCC-1]MUV36454.1 hypothetical protein [Lentibacillus sp. JNUCC-1]
MGINQKSLHHIWLIFIFLVVAVNLSLYHTAIGRDVLTETSNRIVIGSIIDLALVLPVLFCVWRRKWDPKHIAITTAGGLILVRFLIPMEFLAPYATITLVGFIMEGLIIVLELFVIFTLFKYMPKITRASKSSSLPLVFAFPQAVDYRVKNRPIVKVICSELLMFYYALASWKRRPQLTSQTFTLHKKSSQIAWEAMLIHAILFETIGIHFWLYDKYFLLSVILLVLNVYSIMLIIADIQAVRLNPLNVNDEGLYISLGLMKRMEIKWTDIEDIFDAPKDLKRKVSKDTIEFIARDFEQATPDVILKLKHPVKATFIMGLEKEYERVAIRVDDPRRFRTLVKSKMNH